MYILQCEMVIPVCQWHYQMGWMSSLTQPSVKSTVYLEVRFHLFGFNKNLTAYIKPAGYLVEKIVLQYYLHSC